MDKDKAVLATLAAASDIVVHTPVQIQKLMFLIDKKVAEQFGGPFFNFIPYDYGPFDTEVYNVLERLYKDNYVEIISSPELSWKKYRLTPKGYEAGLRLLGDIPEDISLYIKNLSEFVRKLNFAELIATIYHAYPEMKVNSVFRT